ncbi:MAG: hypothetical protein RR937_08475 [Ruthenibacterium sp.]
MKKSIVFLVTLTLALSLAACDGMPTVSVIVSSAPASASSTAISSTAPSSEPVVEMTVEEAKTLVQEKVEEGVRILNILMNGNVKCDQNAPLEAGSNVYLVTEPDYPNVAALKAAVEAVYSKKVAEEDLYPGQFDGEYTHFKDSDGKLYIDQNVGGMGVEVDFDYDSLVIVSQTSDSLEVEMERFHFGESQGASKLNLIKENGNWVLDSKL